MKWTDVNDALPIPDKKVIAKYKDKSYGKRRTIMAIWLPEKFLECNCEYECDCEYDERLDRYCLPEGWYEVVENWPDWYFIPVTNGTVTHWMNLPD